MSFGAKRQKVVNRSGTPSLGVCRVCRSRSGTWVGKTWPLPSVSQEACLPSAVSLAWWVQCPR